MKQRSNKQMKRALERLQDRRLAAEARLADVRRSLDREVGWAPRSKVWVLPLVAFGVGLALALARRRRSRE